MSDGEINVDSIDGEVLTTANIVGQLYPQGEKGDKGDPGNDGFSPTVTTEKVGKTTTITITDAQGEHTATILDGADGQGSGDMRTEVYDVNQNGIVDNAEKVNGKTVLKDVPADAVFTDTTYTAGTGIDITNGVITNTQTSAEWGNITGTLSDQTDLKNALDDKADTSSLSSVATSGSYTDLSDKPSIPTNTSDLTNNSGFIDKDVNNLTNYDTSTTVDTKISNSEEVLIGSDSGIKASHELWVDTNDVTPYVNSEISNDYGTAQNLGYSQEYQNAHNVVVSTTEPTNKSKVWLQHSSNLYNGKYTTQQYVRTNNGALASSGNWSATDFIPVDGNTTYTYSGITNELSALAGLAFYTSDGVFISSVNSTTYTFTTPANARLIRISLNSETPTNIMFNLGSTAIPYEAYVQDKEYILNTNNTYEEFTPQNDVYSSTEQVIGTWIDGKPIYRFVAKGNFSNHTAGTGFYETHPNVVANVDTLVSINAIRNNNRSILYMKNFSNDYWLFTYFEQNGFTFSGNMGLTTSDYYVVTLEYTKTTD